VTRFSLIAFFVCLDICVQFAISCYKSFCRLVKPLFDSVVALPLDDPPLALAAAAVLYFLALDVRLNICCFCLELEHMVV
jgi:hypothetical protein